MSMVKIAMLAIIAVAVAVGVTGAAAAAMEIWRVRRRMAPWTWLIAWASCWLSVVGVAQAGVYLVRWQMTGVWPW